jgi:exodeoxyribonuclease V alpha subunit
MRSHSTANATTPTETLTGIVERITFHSEESGYTVARLKLPKSDNLTTIISNFANIQAGLTLQITGYWRDYWNLTPEQWIFHAIGIIPSTAML